MTPIRDHPRPRAGTVARRPRGGFTLVETIIVLTILSIAIPGVLWSIRDATAKRSNPILVNQAHWLAAEKLEDVIADRNSPSRGYSYVVAGNYPAEASVSGFTNMGRSVAIVETAPQFTAGVGLKTVTVSVTYTDAQNTAQSVSIATVLTDYTP